jgi:chemotaxis protein CheD
MTAAVVDRTIYVTQGEFKVSGNPQDVFSTVLGSCVAVCLWDEARNIGGMNHFLLPSGPDSQGDGTRYGVHAMELLLNAMFRQGTRRQDLRAKIFGGARISANLRDIGGANATFAKTFLATEEIACVAASTGGTQARRVLFRPFTGQVRQLIVAQADEPAVLMPVAVPAAGQRNGPILF